MSRYDLTIAHRVCPALAKVAVGYDNKRDMVVDAVRSMAVALKGIKVRLIVILDGCPDYRAIFERTFEYRRKDNYFSLEFIEVPSIGNQATYEMQVDLLMKVEDSEFVYFSEDDYLYAPCAFEAMMGWLRTTGDAFVTALDHPDRYAVDKKNFPGKVGVSEYCHWRETWSTCLTFMTRPEVLRREAKPMRFFARFCDEGTQWEMLTKRHSFDLRLIALCVWRLACRRPLGEEMYALTAWKHNAFQVAFGFRYRLWSPLPSLAVHLANRSIPPHSEKIVSCIKPTELSGYREALCRHLRWQRQVNCSENG